MDAFKDQRHHRHLDYNDLARAVEDNENMYFLRGKSIIDFLFLFILFINYILNKLCIKLKYIAIFYNINETVYYFFCFL